jgi:hypothetical protein
MVNTISSLAMFPAERPRTGAGSQVVVRITPCSLGAFGAADGASPVHYMDGLLRSICSRSRTVVAISSRLL